MEARKRQMTLRGASWETTYPGHGEAQLPRGLDKRGRGAPIDRVIAVWWVGATQGEVVDAVKGRRVRREVALRVERGGCGRALALARFECAPTRLRPPADINADARALQLELEPCLPSDSVPGPVEGHDEIRASPRDRSTPSPIYNLLRCRGQPLTTQTP
jgi:hypothetical protein